MKLFKVAIKDYDIVLAEEILFALNAQSITETEEGIFAIVSEENIDDIVEEFGYHAEITLIENRDWVNSWAESFLGIEASERTAVVTPGFTLGKEIEIIVSPENAFGAGTHPTTRLCIRLIEEVFLSFPVKSFLDIGSGSGVLAILAAKLGALDVTAIEVDKAAYEKSIENAEKNSVNIKILNSGIEDFQADFEYDIVCANLHSKLIEDNIVSIKKHAGENSFVILSGIMNIWADDMERIFLQHALSVSKKITEDEWVAYLLSCE